MRIHWYWPFLRSEEADLARAVVRPGDTLQIETMDRDGAPAGSTSPQVTVVRDLPDVDRDVANRAGWLLSRARTYGRREAARRRQWREFAPDVVHIHYVNRFTDAVAPMPRPLVMSVHDVVPHVSRLGRPAEARLVGHIYRRADALVVHHDWLRRQLQAVHGVDASLIHVVPHQVYPVSQVEHRPPEPPQVLFFGTLRANKGLQVLEAAMPLLDQHLQVVVAGRGDESVERLARSMAAADPRVSVEIGRVSLERKRALFNESSVVVLPYTSFASQSGVVHDAYGHGRPVVVTDVGALGDSVTEDATGRVVPVGDAPALARAIHEVLEPDAWLAASSAARRVADTRAPAAVGRVLRGVYDDVLNRTG